MKNFLLLIIAVILILAVLNVSDLSAQERKGNLGGVVSDSTNGEVMAFCSVYIPELKKGTNTDARGVFLFTGLEANRPLTLVISYVGYASRQIPIRIVHREMLKLRIKLMPIGVNVESIEVVADKIRKENATNIGIEQISARQLEALPKSVETDVLRSLQFSPGVQSSGDASARFYVRGGANNQNLILLDDMPIYNPYHAFGIFSSINPDMINNMEFHKGGFPAEFNGRLSSVLKIATKDGNNERFGFKTGISMLSAKALVEGPMPLGSFIITGRKSIYSDVMRKFTGDKSYPYDFYDLSLKVNISKQKILEDAKFTFIGFFSGDKIENKNPAIQDFKWANNVIGFNYFQIAKIPLIYNLAFSYSHFAGEIIPNLTDTRESKNTVGDFTAKLDISYAYETGDELDLGIKIQEIKTNYKMRSFNKVISELVKEGIEISTYVKYVLLRWKFIGLDVGSRMSLSRMAGGGESRVFEPRVRMTLRITPQFALKFAHGYYRQNLTTISDENEVLPLYEPWIIVPLYLEPSNARHYIAGIATEFIPDVFLNIDAYFKKAQGIAIVNNNKFKASDRDLVPGNSTSKGLEVELKTTQRDFSLNTSYTLAWVINEINGVEYSPRYDIRHNFNINANVNLGNGWSTSATWVYTSGYPYTQAIGYFDALDYDAIFKDKYILQYFSPTMLLGGINAKRLPSYHRLDLSISKVFTLGFLKGTIDLSVINVYNKKNIFYFDRTTGQQINMLPILPTVTAKLEI